MYVLPILQFYFTIGSKTTKSVPLPNEAVNKVTFFEFVDIFIKRSLYYEDF